MKHPSIKREGVLYSAYSDRGRQVAQEMRRDRFQKVEVPISVLAAVTVATATATAVYA